MPLSPNRIIFISGLGLLAAFWLVYGSLFPSTPVNLGHDYNLHYPNLLAGYFWVEQNGWFQAPWFSPGQCAGVPYLGDLNVAFYSAPQVFTVLAGPSFAVQATVLLFAAIGFYGTALLARDTFNASLAASLLAGALVLFNGFFIYRAAIGHLTFHPIMLTPVVAWLVLGGTQLSSKSAFWLRTLLVGAAFAVMFHAGMIHGVIPAVLVIIGLWAMLGLRDNRLAIQPLIILGLAAVVAGLLSAGRLQAALAFMSQFPRADYPLPGFVGLWDAIVAPFQAVFLTPPGAWAVEAMTNRKWSLGRHEWEYGISAVGLIVLVAGLGRAFIRHPIPHVSGARLIAAATLALVIALPIATNIYGESWNALLKSIPIIGQSSSLVRWYVVYTFLAAILCAPALDAALDAALGDAGGAGRNRAMAATLGIATVIAWSALEDRTHYLGQTYDGTPIQAAYDAVTDGAPVPAVATLTMTVSSGAGRFNPDVNRNNAIARGESELLCNQPMFGYTLENFPLGESFTGDILEEDGWGGLNIKNPACYMYPTENNCQPGESFLMEAEDAALAFAAYKPFPFERPARHDIAVWLNIGALLAWLLATVGLLVRRARS